MSAVAFIRRMVESGFSYEDALAAAEAFEATVGDMLPPARSKRQERNRRYYEGRKASEPSEKRLKASETSETSETPQKVSPKPPSKNAPPSPPKGGSSPPLVENLAEQLWQTASPASRNRSGRPSTRRATSAALAKGATAEALIASVRDHCRKSGDHAKGLHRIIEAELWRESVPRPEPPRADTDPAYRAYLEAHFRATGEWKSEWGERPKIAA